jgi:hypothetical protein
VFDWLAKLAGSAWHGVTSEISGLLGGLFTALSHLLGSLTGRVSAAWDYLVHGAHDLELAVGQFGAAVWQKFDEVLHHWIPNWAWKAWWYISHPGALAHLLFWWLVHELEGQAFAVVQYLGEFTVHLVMRNLRKLLHLAEAILAAAL